MSITLYAGSHTYFEVVPRDEYGDHISTVDKTFKFVISRYGENVLILTSSIVATHQHLVTINLTADETRQLAGQYKGELFLFDALGKAHKGYDGIILFIKTYHKVNEQN